MNIKSPIIKKIEYFDFNGTYVDKFKMEEVLQDRINLNYIYLFDENGNKIRENGFDGNMNESFFIEYKYDNKNHLIEKIQYRKYDNQLFEISYLTKYFYVNELLINTRFFIGDDKNGSCYAISENFYDEKDKKIKTIEADSNGNIELTILFNWESEFIYKSKTFNKLNIQTDRHHVELNNDGQNIVHKHNFYLEENAFEDYPMITICKYDSHGNIQEEVIERNMREVERNVRELSYDKFENLNYQNNTMNGKVKWTQFRNIEYY